MTHPQHSTWYRVLNGNYDAEATLPHRQRLIVLYKHLHRDQMQTRAEEAFIHNGEWYWWDSTDIGPMCRKKVPPTYNITAWSLYPLHLLTETEPAPAEPPNVEQPKKELTDGQMNARQLYQKYGPFDHGN